MSARGIIHKLLSILAAALAGLFLLLAFAAGTPDQDLNLKHPKVREVVEVQEAVTPGLMAVEDVLGTAVGQDYDGEMMLVIYVNLEGKNLGQTVRSLPRNIRGVRAAVEITEPFRAMPAKPGRTTASHTAKQTPPIQLGTSGSWGYDLANGYCCGGTLGSLVQKFGIKYILSNYHVFEADIESGGNGIVAHDGDPIIQPGLIDVSCSFSKANVVGGLVISASLPQTNIDAGIAATTDSMVSADGAILEIGTISSQIIAASINQAVKKSGRTTGLTRSKVTGLNATVSVAYDNECAGDIVFTKVFTGQIIIGNRGNKFLAGGDSGSLMVEDIASNPRAVGLLFAGSSTLAVANPIGEVLNFFGATMVGN